MRKLYEAVQQQLNRIDFEAIWPGFTSMEFALIGEGKVFLLDKEIPVGETFWANTVTTIEGKPVATWCVGNPEDADPEKLAANIVHEMFHGFQPGIGKTYDYSELTLMSFPDNPDAYRIKSAELLLLKEAYTKKCPAALAGFISLRKARANLLGNIIQNEFCVEDNEGTAEYAGLAALRQLNPDKFEAHIKENHLMFLEAPKERLFSVRFTTYFTGSILCLTLKDLNITDFQKQQNPRPLFETITHLDTLEAFLQTHQAEKAKKFTDLLSKPHNTTVVNATITGFDPMNMWRMGDQYYCARFIALSNGDEIKGPVIINIAPGTERQITSYITPHPQTSTV